MLFVLLISARAVFMLLFKLKFPVDEWSKCLRALEEIGVEDARKHIIAMYAVKRLGARCIRDLEADSYVLLRIGYTEVYINVCHDVSISYTIPNIPWKTEYEYNSDMTLMGILRDIKM